MQKIKTKSQMIMQIADLSEQNTLLREELYKKSEIEQSLQSLLEENSELKEQINHRFNDYWHKIEAQNNHLKTLLAEISVITNNIRDLILHNCLSPLNTYCLEESRDILDWATAIQSKIYEVLK